MKKHVLLLHLPLILFSSWARGNQCEIRSCHGDVGNLAAGRDVQVTSTCGQAGDTSQMACFHDSENCISPVCESCVRGQTSLSHPSSHMMDSPFANRDTYWLSDVIKTDHDVETVQFDLGTAFYFTHMIMVFRSPRPGAMSLERSVDEGKTWQVYQYYARNCTDTLGMEDNSVLPHSQCTTQYSDHTPCTRGEVIYRVLNPVDPIADPYSVSSRHLLKITNLRIRMWKPQVCADCKSPAAERFRHFAVYDLIIRGTCFCNGHAESCAPFENDDFEPHDTQQAVVHGKCICEHNTAGFHCSKCLPLYNDASWRAGNGHTGEPNACQRCMCHGHAESCHFDHGIWEATGKRSGGVCDNCRHNTEGRRCDRCRSGFFRRPDSYTSDPDVCQDCNCHQFGTVSMQVASSRDDVDITQISSPSPCDLISGQCRCKDGVGGRRCDRCLSGYWGLGMDGCKKCLCPSGSCDQTVGACLPNYEDEYDEITPRVEDVFYNRAEMYYRHNRERYPLNALHYQSRPHYPLHFPQYPQERMAASKRPSVSCICKEKELNDVSNFCHMKYDYAVKIRVLSADDDGTNTEIAVAVKRIIKQNKVKIRKGKMIMYPESWTVMGCTCPVLLPSSDYIVVGHEDVATKRLMINMNSFVKRWQQKKNWARVINKVFRNKCD